MNLRGRLNLIGAALLAAFSASTSPLTPAQLAFFENKIRPLLVENCYKCHSQSSEKIKGGLLLDTREGLLQGGNSGPAVVPGDPEKSLLIKAIRYVDPDLQMPPPQGGGKKLSTTQIADVEAWVTMGAPDPRAGKASVRSAADEGKRHWAFQPVKKPPVPLPKTAGWAKTPLDSFILAKLEAKGLKPNPAAGKRTLIRRVTLDLTGLPPTLEEVRSFLDDQSPDAWAKVVDRLLASPRYGERWARHWLDVARYSDTKGEFRRQRETPNYPHAWTYRDYVIRSFNEDKPFNRFILEQIAADKLIGQFNFPRSTFKAVPPASGGRPADFKPGTLNLEPDPRDLAALGFLTVGDRFMGQPNDIINDRIDVVTKGFLGLTVSCARCHDHKFDPIPTKDYYSLHGIFASSREPEQFPILEVPSDQKEYADFYTSYTNTAYQIARLQQEFRALRRSGDTNAIRKRREVQREAMRKLAKLDQLEMNHPGAPTRAMTLGDIPRPRDSAVLIRGQAGNKGAVVPRQFLELLSAPIRQPFKNGSGRLELAQAIADPKNPLTPRVIVNRVWLHHFGDGFVTTPDDFGTMSAPPSHPELLDWLASEFVEPSAPVEALKHASAKPEKSGASTLQPFHVSTAHPWSLKRLHRLICNSAVYQQSSADQPRAAAVDPQNRWLWRWNIQRLEFEAIRDSLLVFANKLDPLMGGRPVDLTQESHSTRRTVYARIDRQNLPEMMSHFDFANPDMPTGKRHVTTAPQQALFFMNSPLVVEAAKSLVSRTDFRLRSTIESRISFLYEMLFQRPPRSDELRLGVEFVSQKPSQEHVTRVANADFKKARQLRERGDFKDLMKLRQESRRGGRPDFAPRDPLTAWEEYAHALLQANELIFVQ